MLRYDTKFLKIFGEFFGNTAKEEQRKPVQEKFNVLRSIIIRVEYILRWRCFLIKENNTCIWTWKFIFNV